MVQLILSMLVLIPVKVEYVVPQWILGQAAVVLKDTTKDKILPIFIGDAEANSIEMALKGIQPGRPQTHDLIIKIIKKLNAKPERVVITDLQENIYFAELHIRSNGKVKVIDSRPSDAIAIAVRAKIPVFVDEQVFRKYSESTVKSGKKKSDL